MAIHVTRGKTDGALRALTARLKEYLELYPSSEIELYRSNPACIRIRVVDRRFARMSILERHDHLWDFLAEGVPEDVMAQVSVLLAVTPKQARQDNYRLDFDDPVPARP